MHSFHIYRYDPDQHATPHMQVLDLEVLPGDRMLLQTLAARLARLRLCS